MARYHNVGDLLDSQRRSAILTDVVLVCGEEDFPVHKNVLSATSEYFRTMFSAGEEENGNGRIELTAVNSKEMEIVLPFLYKGTIEDVDDPDLLKDLLKTSHVLGIQTLFRYCYNKLCRELSCKTFLEIINLADVYNDEGMTKSVVTCLAHNFTAIVQSPDFLRLNASQMQKIVHHHHICIATTDQTITELLRWAEVEEGRKVSLQNILLNVVDFENVSTLFLRTVLREHEFINNSETVSSVIEVSPRNSSSHDNEPRLLCLGKKNNEQVSRIYDIKSNQWLAPKNLSFHCKSGMSIVWFSGYVYFIGGGEPDHSNPSTTVYKYNPVNNTVISMGNIAIPVCQAGAGVLYKSIYVVNGVNEDDYTITTVQRYNPVTDCCETVASTNNGHNRPHVFSYSNYLYIVGSDEGHNSVEQYNPECDHWTIVTAVPGQIQWCTAAFFMEKLLVVPDPTTSDIQIYDFCSQRWTKKKISGSPYFIFGLFPTILNEKHLLLVLDNNLALHVYDNKEGIWIGKSVSNKEPWDPRLTCVI